MIFLRVPALLSYRDLVTRAVATAYKAAAALDQSPSPALPSESEAARELVNELVSAVGEAFNNAVEHAYGGASADRPVEVAIEYDPAGVMLIRVSEWGQSFDLDAVPNPDLAALPESGMGLFIIRSFVDELVYEKGDGAEKPNVLRMKKRLISSG
ncbi:MAG: ATP-binding protein [Myxococcota bacterium]